MIYFVTGNPGKVGEFKTLIPEIQQLELDLDEIQSLDPKVVIQHKLEQAARHHSGALIVEDTNLSIDCLGGLPGTFIRWFEKAVGLEGIAKMATTYPDRSATARATIGYRDQKGDSRYFVGEIRGTVVTPRGTAGFGWDSIFVPDGYQQTFAELGPEIKNRISMRRRAIERLKTFLSK